MPLPQSRDWDDRQLTQAQRVLCGLLDQDVASVQLGLADYQRCKAAVFAAANPSNDERRAVFHHAKVFVCAMRRVARLAEALASKASGFPPSTASAIKLAWRTKKASFDSFIDPRNAIEHIDEELKGRTTFVFTNLSADRLLVVDDRGADITEESMAIAVSFRQDVLSAIPVRSEA